MVTDGTAVELVEDIPEYGLVSGDRGTVMLVYDSDGDGIDDYEVFFEKIDVSIILQAAQFKPAG